MFLFFTESFPGLNAIFVYMWSVFSRNRHLPFQQGAGACLNYSLLVRGYAAKATCKQALNIKKASLNYTGKPFLTWTMGEGYGLNISTSIKEACCGSW